MFIKWTKKIGLWITFALLTVITLIFGRFYLLFHAVHPMHLELDNALIPVPDAPKPNLALGKRIYEVRNGCIDCHGKDLSGKLIMDNAGIGTISGTNITPYTMKDRTDADLIRAIKYGVHPSGRSLRFMPSYEFVALSKDDMLDLIAYIRSVPTVPKLPKENHFGPVTKVLSAFGKMPIMFPANSIDHTLGFQTKPTEEISLEFGKYLAQSCIGCHKSDFTGGKIPGGDPSWPLANNIRLGKNSGWTQDEFMKAMVQGISKTTGLPLRPPMPVATFSQMNEMELKAMWQYLSSLN